MVAGGRPPPPPGRKKPPAKDLQQQQQEESGTTLNPLAKKKTPGPAPPRRPSVVNNNNKSIVPVLVEEPIPDGGDAPNDNGSLSVTDVNQPARDAPQIEDESTTKNDDDDDDDDDSTFPNSSLASKMEQTVASGASAASNRVAQDQARKQEESAMSAKASDEAIKLLNPLRAQIEVEICLLGAEDLVKLDKAKGCSPYVVVQTLDEHNNLDNVGTSSVKKQTTSPRWDEESFNIIVPVANTGVADYRLRLVVYDHDRLNSKHVCLGQVIMTKEELLAPRLGAFCKPLRPHDSTNNARARKVTGSLELRLHLYGRVVIAIDRARQLRNADGRLGVSDPYAVCSWVGRKARRLARTPTVNNNLNPTWNHPLIVLVPMLLPLHGGHVTIDVFDDDWMGRDDFLGRAVLDGEFLMRQRTPDTLTLPLKGRHPRERAQGSIDVRVFVHAALFTFAHDMIHDVSRRTKTLNEIPRVHATLTVLHATGLRRADCCGLVSGDPYAVVYRGGKKIGRTPTRSKSINPVWETRNTFRLSNVPTALPRARKETGDLPPRGGGGTNTLDSKHEELVKRKENSAISGDLNETTDESETPQSSVAPKDYSASEPESDDEEIEGRITKNAHKRKDADDARLEGEQTEEFPGEFDVAAAAAQASEAHKTEADAAKRGEPFVDVRIDLFDDDAVSREFLGTAVVNWHQLMKPGEHELVLADRSSTQKKSRRRYAIRGTVTVHVELDAVVQVVINEGAGFAQHDPYDKADPYAIAKWGLNKPVSKKTAVRNDNLDPRWYGPSFELEVPIHPKPDHEIDALEIEVWDKDKWTSDDFMGVASVPAEELLWPSPGLPRYLARRPGKSEDPAPQGYVELDIRASFVPGLLEARPAKKILFRPEGGGSGDDTPYAEICVRVLRAGGLVRQDLLGGADPFVLVRHDGRFIGRTGTRHNTLKPVWKNEAFSFTLRLDDDGNVAKKDTELRLEIWNADLTAKQFMGVIRLGPAQLLTPHGIMRYALLPEKPSAKYLASPNSYDPKLGWIEIDVSVSSQLTIDIIKAEGLRAADSSGTSDPYVQVRWAGPNARKVARCSAEKRTLSPKWFFMLPLSVPLAQPDSMFASLVLEVWDYDLVGSHDFLGLCVIDPHELVSAAETSASKKDQTRRLLNRDKCGRERQEAQGTIFWKVRSSLPVLRLRRKLLDMVRAETTSNVLDGAHVKFEILKASHLKNMDTFGLSDPYVAAYAYGRKIGATSVVSNSLNPVWPGDGTQVFTIKNFPTFGDAEANAEFMVRLAIYDSDFGRRDDLMGEAALTWKLLMSHGTHELAIKGRVFDPKRAGEKAVLLKKKMEAYAARVGLSRNSNNEKAARVSPTRRRKPSVVTKVTPTLVVRVWHVAKVRLHLNSAHGLRAADVGILSAGKSDPYAVVKYRGKVCGKTKVQKKTLDPTWYACFELEVPTYEPWEGDKADALIEIFDHDFAGSNDFLGCVPITQDMMLRPHCGDVFELGPRPNAKVGDPMPTGYVNLKIEASYIPHTLEPVSWPRAPAVPMNPTPPRRGEEGDEDESYFSEWGSRDIRTAVDEETRRRYWYERVHGARPTNCPRWWYDPRPLPPQPRRVFDVPIVPPRPSPTKRKYAKFNEPAPGEPGHEFRPTAVIEVNVLRAKGLANTDRFGKSDPYATVRFGPPHAVQTIGRTRVINNSLDPVWGDSPFRFPVPLDSDCGHQTLVVELWDSDGAINRDDALGMCTVTPHEYLNATAPLRRVLRPQPGEPAVRGWVELRISLLGRVNVRIDDLRGGVDKSKIVFAPTVTGWREQKRPRQRLAKKEKGHIPSEGFDVDIPLQREGNQLQIEVLEPKTLGTKSLGIASVSAEKLLCRTDAHELPIVAENASPVSSLRLRVDCPVAVSKLARATRAARDLQMTSNTLPQLASIDIDVLRATNLKSADALSLSDPYVVGWCYGSNIGKTTVQSNTLNPMWENDPSATFSVVDARTVEDQIPTNLGGLPSFDPNQFGVLLEIWDSDGPTARSDFLGHCLLRHDELMKAGEKELELSDRDKFATEAYIAHVGSKPKLRSCISRWCAVCCAPCRCLAYLAAFPLRKLYAATAFVARTCLRPCIMRKPIKGKLAVRVRHHAQVKLRLLEAYNLPLADASLMGSSKGLSDPYCVVEYRGKKTKTKVHANTSDPCFYEELTLSVEIPTNKTTGDLPWDHPGRAFEPAGCDALLISVYDHDTLSADDFLGQVVVRPDFLLRPQNGTHWRLESRDESGCSRGYLELCAHTSCVPGSLEPCLRRQHGVMGVYRDAVDQQTGRRYHFDVWTLERFWTHPAEIAKQFGIDFDARGRPNLPVDARKRGRVSEPKARKVSEAKAILDVNVQELTLDSNDAQAVISLFIVRATDLAATDINGRSDPFAIVRCGKRRVGRTSVKSKTLDPEWLEAISIVVGLGEGSKEVSIELWDHDTVGSDDFLGEVRLTTHKLLESDDSILTLPLRGKPGGRSAKGRVTVHVSVALKTTIEVLSAEHIVSSQQGNAKRGCYCVLSWQGREETEIARTTTVYDTKLSRWDQRFAVAVPLRFPPHDRIRLEVRQHNRLGRDKFVGKIELDASTLLAEMPANEYTGDLPVLRYTLRSEYAEGLSKPRKEMMKHRRHAATKLALNKHAMVIEAAGEQDMVPLLDNNESDDGNDDDTPADVADEKRAQDNHHHNAPSVELTPSLPADKNSFLNAIWRTIYGPWKKRLSPKLNNVGPDQREVVQENTARASFAASTASSVESEDDEEQDDFIGEVGDVLSIRIVPSKDALARYAAALLAWRQRPSANVFPKTHAEIEILRGDSLRQSDLLGKSDPYVEVSVGGMRVGRTKTAKNTLFPKWVDERFLLPMFPARAESPQELNAARVELRVMDEDTVGKHDFLGYLRLEHADLLDDGNWRTLELGPEPGDKSGKKKKSSDESSSSSSSSSRGTLTLRVRLVVHARVVIVGAYALALNKSVLDRTPDAYAVVEYHGKTWGKRTAVRSNTQHPAWYHDVELHVPVPVDGVFGEPAVIKVYDKNTVSKDAVIGEATVSHENLVYPHDRAIPIRAPPAGSSSSSSSTAQTQHHHHHHHQGWLQVQIETSLVPGRVEARRRPNVAPVYVEAIDPRNERVYWYDMCTGEQYWDDPRPAATELAEQQFAAEATRDGSSGRKKFEGASQPPLALLRAYKGFPFSPTEVAAVGEATAAMVRWTAPKENGPPVTGYTVERQRRLDHQQVDCEWRDTGSVYVDAAAQAEADEAAARAVGKTYKRAKRPPPTSVLVDQLADRATYRFRVKAHNGVGRSFPSNWSNEVRVSEPLPEGWTEIVPVSGRPYFHNAKTQQSLWERPEHDPMFLPTELFLRFTPREMMQLKKIFVSHDGDQSRAISFREFEASLPELGETLSASDILWLFYQADLNPKAELSFLQFCRAIDTLKRAREERAPLSRRLYALARETFDYAARPRVGSAGRALIANKEEELKARFGTWRRRDHPEVRGQKYWVNAATGEASYATPAEVRFFVPDALMAEAGLYLTPEIFRNLEAQFAAIDVDGSGAINEDELGLLISRATGEENLSRSRIRGLIREVDVDGSGEIDFDELVLILVTLRKGRGGGHRWARLADRLDEIDPATFPEGASGKDDSVHQPGHDDGASRAHHGPYCVCGCRRLSEAQRRKMVNRRHRRNIFPKLRETQLREQALGGGAAAKYDANKSHRLAPPPNPKRAAKDPASHDDDDDDAAVLVAPQSHLKSPPGAEPPPRWRLPPSYHSVAAPPPCR
ncbi:hypothetical protein CTAYLR_003229 [Chrysophaeum taylorii]|uniref:Uncharacterized protein n=1 Tax=Chrysophaeum taylorii TaxID=2483200 RepID=A0AAD7UB43_9STRA|nr:hypothetical protein CTAYLR_003229 [Chrysophaeum taylorii]